MGGVVLLVATGIKEKYEKLTLSIMRGKSSIFNLGVILLMGISIAGCRGNSNQLSKHDQIGISKPTNKIKVKKAIAGLNCDTTLISQEFSYEALAFNISKADTNEIKSLFLDRAIIKNVKEVTEEGSPYYPYDFTDGTNTIIVLNNDTSYYIEDAEIKNDRIRLNKKISIGMKKDIFLDLLKTKNIKYDTITVKDEELTFESVYIFKDAKLRQIKMGSIVE